VRVKVLRLGIDGTDVELDRGEYGETPAGESELIIGLEGLITRRVPLERFREAFRREPNDVKVVIEL
jgi:hypothetical protein